MNVSICMTPYLAVYNVHMVLCTLHTGSPHPVLHPWLVFVISMYSVTPSFSLRNVGREGCVIHCKIWDFSSCTDVESGIKF